MKEQNDKSMVLNSRILISEMLSVNWVNNL